MFIETLKGVEEGSKKYKEKTGYPENPEWVREYRALATAPTVSVYEWLHYYLQQIMFKKGKFKKDVTGTIHVTTKRLDDAIGPQTPLHTSDEYKDCFKYLKKHAKELYEAEGLGPAEAEKYAELLAKYLLDYPMKAYAEINIVELVKAGETWSTAQLE